MALKTEQLIPYLTSASHGLKLRIAKEFNPLIKQLLQEEHAQLITHIAELEKKKGA